jgi:small subunit ribosomal protein S8
MMTDTLADMLTRIRNAVRIERPAVDMPATKLKAAVAGVLKDEGFIYDYQVGRLQADEGAQVRFAEETNFALPHLILRVVLKYGPEGERVIRHLERASRPGRRLYRRAAQLRPILDGLGISIISTSRGVMSDRRARAQHLGGELLCTVW